jgi:pilus assembly protein CpaB
VLKTKITGPGQRGSLSVILEEGKRAVTVRVDDVRGVAGFILPGDSVDVVLISEDPAFQREGYSDILLHHVKVLAIDQLVAERPEQPTVGDARSDARAGAEDSIGEQRRQAFLDFAAAGRRQSGRR